MPKPGTDPDYTVGILIGIDKDRVIYVLDVKRVRETPLKVEQLILHTAGKEDGQDVMIRMEQEGGASGQIVIDHYKRKLVGYNFKGERPTRSKEDRAKPVSSYAEGGFIKVLQRPWTQSFLDEVEAFKTEGIHDDQMDALSGGFHEVIQQRRRVHI